MEIELERAVGLLDYLGKKVWKDGEEITITRKGKPYLKLVAHPDGDPSEKKPRLGRLDQVRADIEAGGNMWVASELPETSQEIIDAFEGKYSNDDHLFEGYLIRPDSDEETGYSN